MIIKVNTQNEYWDKVKELVKDKFTQTDITEHFIIFSKFVGSILVERKICCTWWNSNK